MSLGPFAPFRISTKQHAKACAHTIIGWRCVPLAVGWCGLACEQHGATEVNSPNFLRISAVTAFAVAVACLVTDAQISGYGTTGPTDGSGRGTGSAGVMTGTGPDVQPWAGVEQPRRAGGQQIIPATVTVQREHASSAKKESRNVRKHLKKTSKRSQAAPTPTATAAP